jgi:hypothetical protein
VKGKSIKRTDITIRAEIKTDSKYYEGSVENLSEEGLFEISFIDIEVSDFVPEKILVATFHNPSGEDLHVQCKIIWLRLNKDNSGRLTYCMGMEIILPHSGYKDFLKSL